MFSLLARLFSAIGHAGQVPPGFMDRVVVSLPKPGGERLSCSAYRPITLLNTEYRLLTKMLATRLGPALASV
eukprot:245950-Chlamydomonas_euryale.AAC.1